VALDLARLQWGFELTCVLLSGVSTVTALAAGSELVSGWGLGYFYGVAVGALVGSAAVVDGRCLRAPGAPVRHSLDLRKMARGCPPGSEHLPAHRTMGTPSGVGRALPVVGDGRPWGQPLLLVGAADVLTDDFKAFSSRRREITVNAVLASAAVPLLLRAVA
jgi:hypothetical protein